LREARLFLHFFPHAQPRCLLFIFSVALAEFGHAFDIYAQEAVRVRVLLHCVNFDDVDPLAKSADQLLGAMYVGFALGIDDIIVVDSSYEELHYAPRHLLY